MVSDNALGDSSVYFISCMRQPLTQELDKIQVLGDMLTSFVGLPYFGSRYLRER